MPAALSDAYGLPVTTTSRDALEAYDRGGRGLLAWTVDALEHFQAALGHDPGLGLAHAGAAVCHFLDERLLPRGDHYRVRRWARAREGDGGR